MAVQSNKHHFYTFTIYLRITIKFPWIFLAPSHLIFFKSRCANVCCEPRRRLSISLFKQGVIGNILLRKQANNGGSVGTFFYNVILIELWGTSYSFLGFHIQKVKPEPYNYLYLAYISVTRLCLNNCDVLTVLPL